MPDRYNSIYFHIQADGLYTVEVDGKKIAEDVPFYSIGSELNKFLEEQNGERGS